MAAGVIAGALAGAAVAGAQSGQDEVKRTRAERLEFLRNWKHHGLDTTADDAALLRVLVEAVKARRGVEVGSYKGFGAINMGVGFEHTGGTPLHARDRSRYIRESPDYDSVTIRA